MKKIILCYVFLTLSTYSAYCGIILKSETEYKTKKDKNKIETTQYFETDYSRIETKVKFKDEKGKSEQNSVVIIRNDKKLIWTVIPEQKGYCEFTFEELKKYANSGTNLIPEGVKIPKDMKFEKTEKTEKIAGFLTTEYDFKKDKEKGKAWITQDSKLKLITEFYNNMLKAMGTNSSKSNGVSLKFESETEEIVYNTEVKSVKFQDNPKDIFELPRDYSKLNKDIWKEYQKNFDSSVIINQFKSQIAERAENQVFDASKNAIQKGLKGVVGF